MEKVKNKVEYIDINKLVLLKNNPRKISKENMSKLKQSIKDNPDYFEARPLIISNRTGENVILAGNQRFKASQKLGLTKVPCIILKDLTEEKEKEIIIRDNVELGDWDCNLLSEWNVNDLNDWGVDLEKIAEETFKADLDNIQDENQYDNTTDKIYSLNENVFFPIKNKFHIPEIREDLLYNGELPQDILYGNNDKDINNKEKIFLSIFGEGKIENTSENNIICFYTDDYKFETIWQNAVKNCQKIKDCGCRAVLSPDFSVWRDAPLPYQIMSRYKSNWCARYWQEFGIKVIPSLSWGGLDSYEFTFLGIPKNASVVACQCRTIKDDLELNLFFNGLKVAYETLKFKKIIIYGGLDKLKMLKENLKDMDFEIIPIRSRNKKKQDLGLL